MRITLAYNLRTEELESQAELLVQEDVDRLVAGLGGLGHAVSPVEVTGRPDDIVDRLISSKPDLVFNVAEGISGRSREAFYPAIYEQLGLAYTGGGTSLLYIDLDKRLSEKILATRGIRVPKGTLISRRNPELPDWLSYPVIIKPNYEGSSIGISKKSIAHTAEEAGRIVIEQLEFFPDGLDVEEFIPGRELTIPMLEGWPGRLLEVVEARVVGSDTNILDYELKMKGRIDGRVQITCPAELSSEERMQILSMAERIYAVTKCPDWGRVDIRLHDNGVPYFIEMNALPCLHPEASLMTSARCKGLGFTDVLGLVVESASRRYGLEPRRISLPGAAPPRPEQRPTCREVGIRVRRFETGRWNAITDVADVQVGHVTHIRDGVFIPREKGTTSVRTGITAVVPRASDLFNQHLVAGGFILNGIGDMSGLIQAMEWGWLETPILLTNTMSVGLVHSGIIQYMVSRHPELGRKVDVIIPIVGETNDAFLNDVRIISNTPEEAMLAIERATSGPVLQGSVGGGTGMISFDFAGGVGTSSRLLPEELGGYTVGVLVQSNFGKMHNLTIDGAVVGRQLDPEFPKEGRRGKSYGSVIVVVATDAPLLSPQLNRVAVRAALGLGRVGSFAAATSGEIIFAFSTGNRISREDKENRRTIDLSFVTDEHLNLLYEAVIETTEEAVLNSMFCSKGMVGREGRYAPPIPVEKVLESLARGRTIFDR